MSSVPDGASVIPLISSEHFNDFVAVLVGHFLSLVGYGFTFFQTYAYFTHCARGDDWFTWILAGLISSLDTVVTIIFSRYVYERLVIGYWTVQDLYGFTVLFPLGYVLSTLTVFTVQLSYSYHIYLQSNQFHIPILMAFLSISGLTCSLASSVPVFRDLALYAFGSHPCDYLSIYHHSVTFFVALLQSVILGTAAYSRNLPISSFRDLYDWIVLCLIDSGAVATLFYLSYLVMHVVDPLSPRWIPFLALSTKLIVNAMLSYLRISDLRLSSPNSSNRSGSHQTSGIPVSSGYVEFQIRSPNSTTNRVSEESYYRDQFRIDSMQLTSSDKRRDSKSFSQLS